MPGVRQEPTCQAREQVLLRGERTCWQRLGTGVGWAGHWGEEGTGQPEAATLATSH